MYTILQVIKLSRKYRGRETRDLLELAISGCDKAWILQMYLVNNNTESSHRSAQCSLLGCNTPPEFQVFVVLGFVPESNA